MVDSGIVPACAKDLSIYKDAPKLAGDRPKVYERITEENKKLKAALEKVPSDDSEKEAFYYCETVKPQMEALRSVVDNRVERFDRRPIEPFELFTSEFGQNSVRIQENSSRIFRKFEVKFPKFFNFLAKISEF